MAQEDKRRKYIQEIKEINLIWGEEIIPAYSPGKGSRSNEPVRVETPVRLPRDRQADRRRSVHKRRRREAKYQKIVMGNLLVLLLVFGGMILLRLSGIGQTDAEEAAKVQESAGRSFFDSVFGERIQGIPVAAYEKHPAWTEDFLTVNEYSRPGTSVGRIKNIFVHYTANPGTNAVQNRSYFEQLKDTGERSASAHFIIGYQGDIIQCIPMDEMAYAVMKRNEDSISIECCYLAEDGSFTPETYDSLIRLLSWLVEAYQLDEEDILRHYDCGGKKCPIYYTEHEEAWEQLKADVKATL